MDYRIKLHPKAKKDFLTLSRKDKERVFRTLESLESDPFCGKKLKGRLSGCYSLRVWPFRIVYSINKNECLVFVIRIS